MRGPQNADVNDYSRFMEWLVTEHLCCVVNTAVTVFGTKACWDCFRRMRVDVVDIAITWDVECVGKIIDWVANDP